MDHQEYPKWIALPGSTPEAPRGVIVNSKAEEEKLTRRPEPGIRDPEPGPAEEKKRPIFPFQRKRDPEPAEGG